MFVSEVFLYNIFLLIFLKFVEDIHKYDPAIMFYTKYQPTRVLIYLIPLVSLFLFFFFGRHETLMNSEETLSLRRSSTLQVKLQ
jgi:hypothetical protein